MKLSVIAFLCSAVALVQPGAHACGPWFPETYLVEGREDRVVLMPEGRFVVEAARIIGIHKQRERRATEANGWDQTLDQDLMDLKEALGTTGSAELVEKYDAMRREMKKSTADQDSESPAFDNGTAKRVEEFDLASYKDLLGQLPLEFDMYTRGAAAYRSKNTTWATLHWEALLDLPKEQRHFRSTWAAFMIGKAYLASNPDRAVTWFEKTRALRDEGFADTLDLSTSSLGWQAQAEKKQGAFVEALNHYAQGAQQTTNGEADLVSLRWTCHAAFQKLDTADSLKPLAQDTMVRQLMSAWIVCCATGNYPVEWASLPRWEEAVRSSAGDDIDTTTADYLAWGAYREGRFADAKQWLDSTKEHEGVGQWVQAKLLLRDGRVDDGLKLLQQIVPLLPTDESWFVPDAEDSVASDIPAAIARAEEGVLLLGRQDFIGAFDCFVRSHYLDDAAYMAERVLTTKELEGYLRTHAGEDFLSSNTDEVYGSGTQTIQRRLSYLLARRYARAQQWDKAMEHLPEKYRPTLEDYFASLKAGRVKGAPKRARAEALYRAGIIAREYGMELMGTENEPDWQQYDGVIARDASATKRRFEDKSKELKARSNVYKRPNRELNLPDATFKALSGSTAERKRVAEAAVKPEKRFHYRFTASDLMWECAKLLPDNDPLTAAALYLGGNWHRNSGDDAYPDRFYQALVRRCSKLPIGKAADTLRWFPKEGPPLPEVTYRKPESAD